MERIFDSELQNAGARYLNMQTTTGYFNLIFSTVMTLVAIGGIVFLCFGPLQTMKNIFGL